MKITLVDRSNYFKGLLLLISKDGRITDTERKMTQRIGKALGFEKEFCERAIDGILENKFIENVPPEFSTKELAAKFIRDGLILACCDGEIHRRKKSWLRSTARKNGLNSRWFIQELEIAIGRQLFDGHLEVDYVALE